MGPPAAAAVVVVAVAAVVAGAVVPAADDNAGAAVIVAADDAAGAADVVAGADAAAVVACAGTEAVVDAADEDGGKLVFGNRPERAEVDGAGAALACVDGVLADGNLNVGCVVAAADWAAAAAALVPVKLCSADEVGAVKVSGPLAAVPFAVSPGLLAADCCAGVENSGKDGCVAASVDDGGGLAFAKMEGALASDFPAPGPPASPKFPPAAWPVVLGVKDGWGAVIPLPADVAGGLKKPDDAVVAGFVAALPLGCANGEALDS
jgi:hypothetical protein